MADMTEELKVGDLIKCNGPHDMVSAMTELYNAGYDTEFVYEHEGKNGYWLQITEIRMTFEKKWRIT